MPASDTMCQLVSNQATAISMLSNGKSFIGDAKLFAVKQVRSGMGLGLVLTVQKGTEWWQLGIYVYHKYEPE